VGNKCGEGYNGRGRGIRRTGRKVWGGEGEWKRGRGEVGRGRRRLRGGGMGREDLIPNCTLAIKKPEGY